LRLFTANYTRSLNARLASKYSYFDVDCQSTTARYSPTTNSSHRKHVGSTGLVFSLFSLSESSLFRLTKFGLYVEKKTRLTGKKMGRQIYFWRVLHAEDKQENKPYICRCRKLC